MAADKFEFEIGPAGEMQKKYGWYAENAPTIRLDPAQVPSDLQDLIPLAERWGIACDIRRRDAINKATHEQMRELCQAVGARHQRLIEWVEGAVWDENNEAYTQAVVTFADMTVTFESFQYWLERETGGSSSGT